MNKENVIIIFGSAHRRREPGKQSADGRLKECVYSRELISDMKPALESMGYRVLVDMEELDLPKSMQSVSAKQEQQRELAMRVNYVNDVCRRNKGVQVLYVSVHVNASPPNDGQWHAANGWQVCVGTKAGKQSKVLADCLFDAAKEHGLKMRQPLARQKYWEQKLYVLNNTICPAVLTENLFQDNIDDCDLLLSDEGRHIIECLHIEGIVKYIESL
jgi:N-acetylmuramoyl-L-alanine amidase